MQRTIQFAQTVIQLNVYCQFLPHDVTMGMNRFVHENVLKALDPNQSVNKGADEFGPPALSC